MLASLQACTRAVYQRERDCAKSLELRLCNVLRATNSTTRFASSTTCDSLCVPIVKLDGVAIVQNVNSKKDQQHWTDEFSILLDRRCDDFEVDKRVGEPHPKEERGVKQNDECDYLAMG